jgi:Tol biopolymer transport system component
VYVVDAQGGEPRSLTQGFSTEDTPSWSYDGQWIYFKSNRSGISQIWKIPAEGGEATQLTESGGVFRPLESPDGQYVYYLKCGMPEWLGTIWRVPVEGGEEEEVLGETVQQGGWDILQNRLYYSKRKDGEWFAIYYLDLETGKKTEYFRHEGAVQGSYLSVSLDEQWIFYAMRDPTITSDIMLVENFQ